MKKIPIALTLLLAPVFGLAQSPYPSPGPTPLARGARLNSNGSMMFGPADLATYTPDAFRHSTDTDDTVAVQAAINAACAAAPAKVLLTRVYNISSAITGTVPAGTGITIEGVNGNAGIITSLATSDVFSFAPSGTPTNASLTTGLRWMTFKDFYIDSTVQRTSGAALHIQWSDSTLIDNVRIGSFNYTTPGTQLNMYDGIYLDKESNCTILMPQIYTSSHGITLTGAGWTSGYNVYYSFGGYIGGGGYMYGNYATASVGIHLGGGCGGVVLGQFDCGQWGKYGLLVDEALQSYSNRELFVRGAFFDASGVCGAYIASNALNILHFDNGWMCGSGRLPGLVLVPGTGFSPENGDGLYVQPPQSTLHINISSGSHLYANYANGVVIGDCASAMIVGADIYGNAVGATAGSGQAGIEIQGGNDVFAAFNNLESNGYPYVIRATDTGNPYFGSSGSCLGCFSYLFFGNNASGCGAPAGSEESIASRTANMYAGFMMGPNALNNGPFPAQFQLAYNASPTTSGVSLGLNSSSQPSAWWTQGSSGTAFGIADNSGIEAHVFGTGLTVYETLSSSGMTLQNGAGLTINNSAGNATHPSLYATTITLSGTAIDWSQDGPFSSTILGNVTYTFSNQVDGQEIKVAVTNTGSYTVTWPTVKWTGGTAPTQTTGAHTDLYTFKKLGSNIYGSVVQNY